MSLVAAVGFSGDREAELISGASPREEDCVGESMPADGAGVDAFSLWEHEEMITIQVNTAIAILAMKTSLLKYPGPSLDSSALMVLNDGSHEAIPCLF